MSIFFDELETGKRKVKKRLWLGFIAIFAGLWFFIVQHGYGMLGFSVFLETAYRNLTGISIMERSKLEMLIIGFGVFVLTAKMTYWIGKFTTRRAKRNG